MSDEARKPEAVNDDARLRVERRLDDLLAQQQALVERLRDGQQHFQQVARSVWRVQEDERRRLARELHDGIGQNLTALMHLISQALDALPSGSGAVRESLERTRALATSTLDDTRALSRLLRPQILDDLGLEAALRWLSRTVAETHGLDVRLDLEQPLPALDPDRATLAFRAVQEALTNVVRHAQARQVDIVLRRRDGRVQLSVSDDGRGCDSASVFATASESRGIGIGGMRDRVRLFSGQFEIESAPGRGFCVRIEFPA
jgi:signal transduction histidine kinase